MSVSSHRIQSRSTSAITMANLVSTTGHKRLLEQESWAFTISKIEYLTGQQMTARFLFPSTLPQLTR